MSDIVSLMQELIAPIQTSAEGVTTETVSMQRAMVVRRERLNEHIASVPNRLLTGVRSTHRTRQWQRSHEDATEIAILTAKLGFAESNMQDLERVAEHEHTMWPSAF
eukprot:5018455-Amphidinium_carterae.1